MENRHTSEDVVSFEIQFRLFIKIWAGEHIFSSPEPLGSLVSLYYR